RITDVLNEREPSRRARGASYRSWFSGRGYVCARLRRMSGTAGQNIRGSRGRRKALHGYYASGLAPRSPEAANCIRPRRVERKADRSRHMASFRQLDPQRLASPEGERGIQLQVPRLVPGLLKSLGEREEGSRAEWAGPRFERAQSRPRHLLVCFVLEDLGQETVHDVEVALLGGIEEAGSAARGGGLPSFAEDGVDLGTSNPGRRGIERSVARAAEQSGQLVEPPVNAGLVAHSIADESEIELHLCENVSARFVSCMALAQRNDALFRAERDQDAEHDDPHLFQQLAPTVNGMWFVDLHRAMYSCQLAGDT